MWNAISAVGSALALVAFLAATFYAVSARNLRSRERSLQELPKADRLKALQALTDSFALTVAPLQPNNLSADQQFELIKLQIYESTRRRGYTALLFAFVTLLFAIVAVAAIRSVPVPVNELSIAQEASTSPVPRQFCTRTDNSTIIDFGAIDTSNAQDYRLPAAPFLTRCGLTAIDLSPRTSRLAVVNSAGLYDGRIVPPGTSSTFLTQEETNNLRASFTLRLPEEVRTIGISRPVLYGATTSGISYPAWSLSALNSKGEVLASRAESITVRGEGQQTSHEIYGLSAPGFDKIAMIRIESDPRRNGVPFAAFSTALIDRIELRP